MSESTSLESTTSEALETATGTSASKPLRILVWDENPSHAPKELYPKGLNGAIADGLNADGVGKIEALTSNLDDPMQGCGEEWLASFDVLFWWGHARHQEVSDDTMMRVFRHVHERGMGFVALHSAHYSKTFQAVLACTGHLKGGWRETTPPDTEEITVCAPRHPIAEGVSDFTLDQEEMYGAPFGVPPPQTVVLQSYFPLGGEYFPSGACWTVGEGIELNFTSGGGTGGQGEGVGRVFYFRPGHETFGTFFDPHVRRVLHNAALWAGKRV